MASLSKKITKKITKLENQSLVDSKQIVCEKQASLLGRFYVTKITEETIRELSENVKRKKGSKSKIRITPEGISLIELGGSFLTKGPRVLLPVKNTLDLFLDDDAEGVVIIIQLLKNRTFEIIYHRSKPDDAATLVHGFNIVRVNNTLSKPGSSYISGYEIQVRERDGTSTSNWTLRSKDIKKRETVLKNKIVSDDRKFISIDASADRHNQVSRYGNSIQNNTAVIVNTSRSGQSVAVTQSAQDGSKTQMDHNEGDLYATVDLSAKATKTEEVENSMDFDSDDDSDREFPPPPPPAKTGDGFTEERSKNVEYNDGQIITTETVVQKGTTTGLIQNGDDALAEMRAQMNDMAVTDVQAGTVTTTYTERKVVTSSTQGATLVNGHDAYDGSSDTNIIMTTEQPQTITTTVETDNDFTSPILTNQSETTQSVFINKQMEPNTSVFTVTNDTPPIVQGGTVLDSTVTVEETRNNFVQTSSPVEAVERQYTYSSNTVPGQVLPATVEVQPAQQVVTHTREYSHQTIPDNRVLSSTVVVDNQSVPIESHHLNTTVQVQPPESRVLQATVVEERRTTVPQTNTYVQQVALPNNMVIQEKNMVIQDNPSRMLNATVVEERRTTTQIPQQNVMVAAIPPQHVVVAAPAPQPQVVVAAPVVQNTQYQTQVTGYNQAPAGAMLNSEVVKVTKTSVTNEGNQGNIVLANGGQHISESQVVNRSGENAGVATVVKEVRRTQTKQQSQPQTVIATTSNGSQRNVVNTQTTRRQETRHHQPSHKEHHHHQQQTITRAKSAGTRDQYGQYSTKRGEFRNHLVAVPSARHHRYYTVRSTGGAHMARQQSFDTISQTPSTVSTTSFCQDHVDKPIEKCYEGERKRNTMRGRVMVVERPRLYHDPNREIYHRVSKTSPESSYYSTVKYRSPVTP